MTEVIPIPKPVRLHSSIQPKPTPPEHSTEIHTASLNSALLQVREKHNASTFKAIDQEETWEGTKTSLKQRITVSNHQDGGGSKHPQQHGMARHYMARHPPAAAARLPPALPAPQCRPCPPPAPMATRRAVRAAPPASPRGEGREKRPGRSVGRSVGPSRARPRSPSPGGSPLSAPPAAALGRRFPARSPPAPRPLHAVVAAGGRGAAGGGRHGGGGAVRAAEQL